MKKPGTKMISTYKNQLKKFGPVPAALGCPKGRQDIRFEALTKYLNKGNSLLDYGCGFGDLFLFLKKKDLKITYNGCDVVKSFIEIAKEKYPKENFFQTEVDKKLDKKYDHIIASGVFNFLYTESKKKHEDLLKKSLTILFNSSKKTLSVDFLSEFVDFQDKDTYHQNVSKLIRFVSENLSRRFLINHSYMPYEFCIHIFKNDEILKPKNVFKSKS